MNLKSPILSTIGNTPIIRIFSGDSSPDVRNRNIYAKIESRNPGFSVKDRIAKAMIEDAIINKKIGPNTTIVEPTSGNTGIGLALVCAALKLKLFLVIPDTMSVERIKILKLLGAHIFFTEGAKGMKAAVEEANNLKKDINDSFMPQQFENPANPEVHRQTTAVEFLSFMRQNCLNPDALVFGVGTGGTLTGVSETIKKYFPKVLVYAVEPENSPVLSGGQPGAHKIQGIGAGFVPKILNREIIDKIITVKNEEAFEYTDKLAFGEGILAGLSSGAAAFAAVKAASSLPEGANIFTLLPDSAERYLSMIFNGATIKS